MSREISNLAIVALVFGQSFDINRFLLLLIILTVIERLLPVERRRVFTLLFLFCSLLCQPLTSISRLTESAVYGTFNTIRYTIGLPNVYLNIFTLPPSFALRLSGRSTYHSSIFLCLGVCSPFGK